MTHEAFELSERFSIPVLVRLVTRLCHSRSAVTTGSWLDPKPLCEPTDAQSWTLLPRNARVLWRRLLDAQEEFRAFTEESAHNVLKLSETDHGLGIITTGIARNYYRENRADLDFEPSRLHIGAYPYPARKIRELARHVDRILVLEEGYPFVERHLRGILDTPIPVLGKEDGTLPLDGELTPDSVRSALGLPSRTGQHLAGLTLPGRPPQLCQGCPHRDSYDAIKMALSAFEESVVTSDIGCYTLGALDPYQAIQSCVCMGASVGMAKGASDAGLRPALAVIGDSTFLHSGVTPLMDAVANDTDMTLLILDNETVAMTGAQPTILPESRLKPIVLGLGVDPAHFHHLEVHPRRTKELADVIRKEMEHPGLSVIVAVRQCIVSARREKQRATNGESAS
jgi:indolepyruvate ferredoxin oxidoreductase alpha subunit